ncbi:caspase family protein [Sedimentitalea todarodis]|uniref:Caspase family protein n=1 Tax=Sedimentitalea todarodis TaxID=1631240 RepID=A0ABU3VCG3_9RHOB|nr:caspase family protein [Sedimentitalea todarodis]MDU9003859.1 caspase family protein [Sedimentitalea todarodis]
MTLLLLALVPGSAAAERRMALVIGNDAYDQVPRLEKAVADATAIAETLTAQGFETITATDSSRRQMNRSISEFTGQLQAGDTAVLFFAGHGVEIDGENYLLPTDIIAPASGERDFIKSESIALSALLDRIRATGARTTIAIIDACRNNPFQNTTGRSIGGARGLGRITAPQGTFVIFSAGAGQLALDELTEDEVAENSVFTRLLLPRLAQPDLELRTLVADLRTEVRDLARSVNHQQFPAYYDELLGDFYFARASSSVQETLGPDNATTDHMRADFDLARSIGTPEAIQVFLDRYTDRKDEFTYRMALQLREKDESDTRLAPEQEPDPAAQEPDRKTIIRETQAALNAAKCSAGSADGVPGPRTRQAFQRFITDTGAALKATDLGTAKALQAIRQSGSRTCNAQPAAQPDAAVSRAQPAGFNIAGNWQFRASCPLFIKTTGTASYTRTGPNSFRGTVNDSLGQSATTLVTLTGRKMKFVLNWATVTTYASGTLAADGRSYSNVASNGCTATAWRVS